MTCAAHSPANAALLLDARRHAMLKAMGVELWWHGAPSSAPAAALAQQAAPDLEAAVPTATRPVPAHALHAHALAQTSAPPHMPVRLGTAQPIAVAQAAAAAPKAAIAAVPAAPARHAATMGEAILWRCGAAKLVQPAAAASGASGVESAEAAQTHWLFVTDDFSDLGEDAQAAEQLLQNMWRAMRLHRHPALWRSSMERVAAPADGQTGSGQAQTLDEVLNQTLAVAAPAVIVLMGRVAAQTLLQTGQPLGVLRQQPHRVAGVPAVATYSPSYLLRASHAKAGAWADLQRAMELARRAPSPPSSG